MASKFHDFVDQLAQIATADDAYNQFAYGNPYNDIRRANLLRYFEQVTILRPPLMLVLEAPGYRGSRLTGVPVTSRRILLTGIPELGLFGTSRGYQDVPEPGFERVNGEQSASIVWSTLVEVGQPAVIWNAYPFHPHRAGLMLTNRAPRRPETEIGLKFLREALDLFGCTQIIAVGNVADAALTRLNVAHTKIRHPAQGGKNDFVARLRSVLGVRS
jgi:hypothetical protein